MKGYEALAKSYYKQKKVFDDAKSRRIENRKRQIDEMTLKIRKLEERIKELEALNLQEKEFEEFDSFRRKAEQQHLDTKTVKRVE